MKKFFILAAAALAFTSCTSVSPLTATSNTVGKRCGIATDTRYFGLFPIKGDHGIDAACKQGGIKKISHVDIETENVLGIVRRTTTKVYGE